MESQRKAFLAEDIPQNGLPRPFNTFPGSRYLLPADKKERDRLTKQHQIITSALGGRLVLAPIELDGSHFILDSGTGPGTWLLELATKMPPSAVLHGIDIETDFVATIRPMNVSFSKSSITDLPRQWTGRFDLVNQRLLVSALTTAEWYRAMAEMHRILVPGGWVQLIEAKSFHGGDMSARGLEIFKALHRVHGIPEPPDIDSHIARILQETGFQGITIEDFDVPLGGWAGQGGLDAKNNWVEVFVALKTAVLRAGGLGIVNSEEEYDKFVNALASEWDDSVGAKIAFSIVIAQKPDIVPHMDAKL